MFQPWRGLPEFRALYNEIKGYTLVTPEASWMLYSLARQALTVVGDFLEAGFIAGGRPAAYDTLSTAQGRRDAYISSTLSGACRPPARGWIFTDPAISRIPAWGPFRISLARKTGSFIAVASFQQQQNRRSSV